MLAIVLTYHELPGRIPTFLAAAVTLIVGMVGLLVQSLTEKKKPEEEAWLPRTKVYRQAPCAIDRAAVDKLMQAVADLEGRIVEKSWSADWNSCRDLRQQADNHIKNDRLTDAFRATCRALMILMDAVQQQRGKEESFRPLWDRHVS
jgi:hypothetical protein